MKELVHHVMEVRGDFACFSRPELKVERWSYPCPTPSAARGIFDAIYFKPQFYWQVERIELLTFPAYIALRRNEVGAVTSVSNVNKWMRTPAGVDPLMADDHSLRQQRQTMALRAPRYRLHARIVPRPGNEHGHRAFDEQFVRRASAGKCWMQPFLGCREFAAYFRRIEDISVEPSVVPYSQRLGYMLYDVFDLHRVNNQYAAPFISVFQAQIEHGVLEVPPYGSNLVLKPDSDTRRVSQCSMN